MNTLENHPSEQMDSVRNPEAAVDDWAELAEERAGFRFQLMAQQWFHQIEQ